MKIREITIQQYGAWKDLNLPLGDSDLSVFYGPNEAGKTTLMRFIRGLLYGYKPFHDESRAAVDGREAWDGTLHVDANGEPLKIRRRWRDESRGKVTVKPNHHAENDKQVLQSLLSDVDETIFEHVYALGLEELQTLATLNRDEVAEQIYGMSLGPEGEILRSIAADIDHRKRLLLSPDSSNGQIAQFLDQQERIQKEVSLLNVPLHKHQQLAGDQQSLNSNIRSLQQKQQKVESELRGFRLMEKVFDPWKQVQEYKRELRTLASLKKFPADGLAQLRSLEKELNTLTREREQLLNSGGDPHQQSGRYLNDESLLKHEPTIRSLYEMSDWFTQIKQEGDKAGLEHDSHRNGLLKMVTSWGDGWSLDRLDQVKVTPENQYQLLKSAQNYQSSLGRWSRLRERYKNRVKVSKQREADLNEQLGKLNGLSLDAALAQGRQHLVDLEELSLLQLREVELASREQNMHEKSTVIDESQEIPPWVQTILWIFGLFGVFFFLWGMKEWFFNENPWNYRAVGGAVYVMVGLMTGAVAWALKNQFGGRDYDSVESSRFQYSQLETELRQTREQIARLTNGGVNQRSAHLSTSGQQGNWQNQSAASLVQQATREVASLEEASLLVDKVKEDRRRLSELRGRFKSMQQNVSDTRQGWCELLRHLGLNETVKVNDAFQNWQGLLEADTLKQNLNFSKKEKDVHHGIWDSICHRIGQVAQQIGDRQYDPSQPITAVADWHERLSSLGRLQSEKNRLTRDAEELQLRINEIEASISTLLTKGGASTRKEFRERAALLGRRNELQELLAMAEQDLQNVASQETELAIVEEDLKKYNPHENATHISSLNKQQTELEHQLQQEFLSLGTLEQKLKSLEEDRRWSRLRFERAQVREQLGQGLEQFLSLQLAEESMHQARASFEKNHQPEILIGASKYLSSLTEGKHRNIWTPLDKRHLFIDDKKGGSLRVEELSSGTREQLFLAIRLALVERYRQQGVELPMVLDDILVNFDQARTEAAVDTLKEYTNNGQQILFFTCHQHLAEMFNQRGANTIQLPKQRSRDNNDSGKTSFFDSSHSSLADRSRSTPQERSTTRENSSETGSSSNKGSSSNRDRSQRTISPETSAPEASASESSERSRRSRSSSNRDTGQSSLSDSSLSDSSLSDSSRSDSSRSSTDSDSDSDSDRSRSGRRSSSSSSSSRSSRSSSSNRGSRSGSRSDRSSRSNRSSRSYSQDRDRDRDYDRSRDSDYDRDRDYERRRGRSSEREERTTRTKRSDRKRTKKLKWYLHRNDPLVDAPSIGPKTAKRFKKIGIKTVDDFLKADPGEMADRLDTKHIKEETIIEWQQQAKLICRIPQIRGHDSQILVAVGKTKPKEIAEMNPPDLLAIVEPFIETSAGSRIIRSGKKPDLEEVTDWIEWAKSARPLHDA